MTAAQARALERVLRRFSTTHDHWINEDPAGLDPGWISVTHGIRKGRPLSFDIAPDGRIFT